MAIDLALKVTVFHKMTVQALSRNDSNSVVKTLIRDCFQIEGVLTDLLDKQTQRYFHNAKKLPGIFKFASKLEGIWLSLARALADDIVLNELHGDLYLMNYLERLSRFIYRLLRSIEDAQAYINGTGWKSEQFSIIPGFNRSCVLRSMDESLLDSVEVKICLRSISQYV